MTMDYVSTTRPAKRSNTVGKLQLTAMNTRRFLEMFLQLGLDNSGEWAEASKEEFDQAIDKALLEVCLALLWWLLSQYLGQRVCWETLLLTPMAFQIWKYF